MEAEEPRVDLSPQVLLLEAWLHSEQRTCNTHIAQTEEPWSRLHETATLSSSRRSVMNYEPQAPQDSLDLQLKSVYDHQKDFLWLRNQVLYQQETVSEDHRLVKRYFKARNWNAPLLSPPQAPQPSLDLQLKSVYDHHKDFLWLRNQVLYQQGTISEDHRSLLMNFNRTTKTFTFQASCCKFYLK
ncbi:cilia- and flagella-associated protein 276 [Lycodopsis pacificus]